MRLFLIFSFAVIAGLGCSDNPLAIIDDYNTPSDVRSAPSNAAIVIDFLSANDAVDFLGFNVYISSTSNMTDARVISNGASLPTFAYLAHTYSNIRLVITNDASVRPLTNGYTYYVAVSAYGTNNYLTRLFQQGYGGNQGGVIELMPTALSAAMPRREGVIVFSNNTFNASADDGIRYTQGAQTNCALFDDAGANEAAATADFYCSYTNIPGPGLVPYAVCGANNPNSFQMQSLGFQNDFYAMAQMPAGGYTAAGTHYICASNHMYALYSPNSGGTYVKIWVTSITVGARVTVTARWAAVVGSSKL